MLLNELLQQERAKHTICIFASLFINLADACIHRLLTCQRFVRRTKLVDYLK